MASMVQAIDTLVARTPGDFDDVAWIGVKLAGRSARHAKRRAVAHSTALRVATVVGGFGVALLPRWLRWLPVAVALFPGGADDIVFGALMVVLVVTVVTVRPRRRRELVTSVRLAVGARYLTAAAERVA